ncbi:hypothetical protein LIER_40377 [Lithospermum erythrorhizon]|uniref:Uncharacterized protein n=1 Tax=Lithospermum erythrorhizon TaxID=34254 RepID=A0AAV3QXW9_LITER
MCEFGVLSRIKFILDSNTGLPCSCLEPTAPEVSFFHIARILPLLAYRVLNFCDESSFENVPPFSWLTCFVEPLVSSLLTWATRHRPRLPFGEASASIPLDVAPKSQGMGTHTRQSLKGHLSSSSLLLGQRQGPLPTSNQVPGAALVDVGGQHSTTVVLEPEDQGSVGSATPQTPSSVHPKLRSLSP